MLKQLGYSVDNNSMKTITNKTPRRGSVVMIDIPNGRGRYGQEWKEVKAVVQIVCDTHLVCVVGGNYARPYCAESYRLIKW
jgi:hypothetical protein